MFWMLLVLATVSSVAAAVGCYALRLRSIAVMIPVQVAFAFAATYGVARANERYAHQPDLALAATCLLMALGLPVVWLLLRLVFGPIPQRSEIARDE